MRVHPAFLEGLLKESDTALAGLADWALSTSPDKELHETIRDKYLSASPELIRGDLSACDQFDVMNQIGTVALPTWIVACEDDRLTPVKYSGFLHESIRGSTLAIIPGAGHLVMMEQPEEFNQLLAAFLAQAFGNSQRPAR